MHATKRAHTLLSRLLLVAAAGEAAAAAAGLAEQRSFFRRVAVEVHALAVARHKRVQKRYD